MKKLIQGTVFLSTLLLGAQISAAEVESVPAKNWSIGIGSYAFSLANDDNSDADLDFSGFNIAAGYAFNNHFQVRATYFLLENDDFSDLESSGFDLMAYGGVGLAEKGFRGYGGAGFFSDEWSISNESESFSGIQFGGGLGYNWGPAALDFVLTLRQADKYEDLMFTSGTYFAMSGNLTISYLF
ncbi:outer membrane beta-barrel protein [Shewanella sp. 6_MG-2023]|uniref:outer membrane beta-barrel protein n=1 Tax=Shewanella sp. 6_MG-2023 TaxID=3062660 RepID=UPI0026E14172|nr:outer membrane beta-barrel protein [Shewanella sp. 6_MG-2023]MDO6618777.1 outer membrane beta-barrel protein [Shewanella sp. 6_MG-2023]